MKKKSFISSLFGDIFKNKEEVIMVIAINLLLGLIITTYGVARGMKDHYIVGLGGSPLITLLKLFWVVPFVVMLSIFYSFVNRKAGMDGRFYVMGIYFVIFFTLFFIANYIGLEKFEFTFMAKLEALYPRFRPLWQSFRYWPQVLFYLHAECIGAFILSVIGWGFVNAVMNVDQSRRLYSIISLGGALGTMLAGYILMWLTNRDFVILFIICAFIVLMGFYYLYSLYRKSKPHFYAPLVEKKKKKKKLSFKESMQVIFNSPYLLLIAIIVFSYACFMPLVEAIHKDFIKYLTKQPDAAGDIAYYTGIQLRAIGFLSIFLILFIGPFTGKLKWIVRAAFTPIVLLGCSFVFFMVIFFPEKAEIFLKKTGIEKVGLPVNPAFLRVWAGMMLVVLGKSFKYIFFDATYNAAYVPLDAETKANAKAAIDGVISRLGKSIGAGFVLFLTTLFKLKSAIGAKNYIIFALILVIICWLFGVLRLSVLYAQKTKEVLANQAEAPKKEVVASKEIKVETEKVAATQAKTAPKKKAVKVTTKKKVAAKKS